MPMFSAVLIVSLDLSGAAADAPPSHTPSAVPAASSTSSSRAADIERAFATVRDEEAADVARRAALDELRVASWTAGVSFRERFEVLLRELATDRQADLRLLALDQLALRGDGFARQLLIHQLEGTGPALVPAPKAALLLAGDTHQAARPTLRRLAATGSGDLREAAVQALGGDIASVPLFASIAVDKTLPSSLRQVASLNLSSTAPDRLAALGPEIVFNDHEDTDLRITVLAALTGSEATRRIVDTPDFRARLGALQRRTAPAALKRTIQRSLDVMAGRPLP